MASKRITSKDVAQAAGVSRTTVSLVLNDVPGIQISDETRQRVIEASRELGYVPDAAARALASRRTKAIGLMLTRSPHSIASDGFLTQVLDSLIETVHHKDTRLMLDIISIEHQKEAYLQLVRAKHIDGVILSGPRFDDAALQALADDGFPTVLMGQVPGMDYYCVDVDNCAASQMAVAHLLNLGHTHIACITNSSPDYTAASERLKGYRAAYAEAGLQTSDSLVRYGDFNLHSGYQQMMSLLEAGEPFSAVFVASDEVAMGAIAAIRERGLRIPEDIALVGFDDLPLASYLEPPLTTIHLPAAEIAHQACQMLVALMEGDDLEARQITLDTHLVLRESCGARRKARSQI